MPAVSETFRLYLFLSFASTSLVLSALMLYLLWRRPRATSRAQRLPERELLSLDQFYERYYASERASRATVLEALTSFASAARVHAGLVRPEDSFAALGADGDDCHRFAATVEVALKSAESHYGALSFECRLVTLDDFIRAALLIQRSALRSAATR